jgi:hypothetical protein
VSLQGDKRREGPNPAGPNEIVACTSCAGDGSPCTHTASNNGCATEVISYFNGSLTFWSLRPLNEGDFPYAFQ